MDATTTPQELITIGEPLMITPEEHENLEWLEHAVAAEIASEIQRRKDAGEPWRHLLEDLNQELEQQSRTIINPAYADHHIRDFDWSDACSLTRTLTGIGYQDFHMARELLRIGYGCLAIRDLRTAYSDLNVDTDGNPDNWFLAVHGHEPVNGCQHDHQIL